MFNFLFSLVKRYLILVLYVWGTVYYIKTTCVFYHSIWLLKVETEIILCTISIRHLKCTVVYISGGALISCAIITREMFNFLFSLMKPYLTLVLYVWRTVFYIKTSCVSYHSIWLFIVEFCTDFSQKHSKSELLV